MRRALIFYSFPGFSGSVQKLRAHNQRAVVLLMFWRQRLRGGSNLRIRGAEDGKYAIGGHPFVVSFFVFGRPLATWAVAQSGPIVQCVRYPLGLRRYIQRYRARETKASLFRAGWSHLR